MRDVLIVGGGLAGTLLAYRLRQLRPALAVTVLEQGERLGGRHTWSLHASDVSEPQRAWLAPLVARSWSGHDVRFPDLTRTLAGAYLSITSERLHQVAAGALADVRFGVDVLSLEPERVRCEGGATLDARCVIDARGGAGWPGVALGWQKFLGQRLSFPTPHGLARPLLMDATVPQQDGFRFVYVLPWTPTELLIEDTRYSDDAALDRPALRAGIAAYAEARGYGGGAVVAEEEGALPIPLAGGAEEILDAQDGAPAIGVRAGLFHATTGYSLPDAVRLADDLAPLLPMASEALARWTHARTRAHWHSGRYFRLLNRLLFRAARPAERWRVLERFYRLPEPLVARFYRGTLTAADRVRILAGRPPVPLARAARVLLGLPA